MIRGVFDILNERMASLKFTSGCHQRFDGLALLLAQIGQSQFRPEFSAAI